MGSEASAIFYWILATLFLSTLAVTFYTLTVILFRTALAYAILDLIATFLASGAFLRAFLRAETLFAALSWAFKAAFLSGLFALASLAFIAIILA